MALWPKVLYKNSPGATVIRLTRALSERVWEKDFAAKNKKARKKRRFIRAIFAAAKVGKKLEVVELAEFVLQKIVFPAFALLPTFALKSVAVFSGSWQWQLAVAHGSENQSQSPTATAYCYCY
jgi:hypothetical protein